MCQGKKIENKPEMSDNDSLVRVADERHNGVKLPVLLNAF